MFKEMGSIEKYGSGIARIKNECQQHGILEPVFEGFQHGFKVTLFKQKGSGGVNIIYETIEKNPNLKAKQIVDILKTPLRSVERELKNLKDQDKIYFKGTPKTGGYHVK